MIDWRVQSFPPGSDVRNRPRPNTRRGLLRALLTVVVLCAVLLGAIFVVSSLTAPSVNAPSVPPTPGPLRTPGPTPSRTPARPQSTPRATAKHDVAWGNARAGEQVLAEIRPAPRLAARIGRGSTTAAPWSAFFGKGRDAYAGAPLFVSTASGRTFRAGSADPYVRPVWHADGDAVLFVRVHRTAVFPGARWSLVQFDVATGKSKTLVETNAMAMAPLGWAHDQVLYTVANETATSVYSMQNGHPRFISILITQPITAPSLSPDGETIAFDVPSTCTYCTVDTFDLNDLTIWNGPTGALNEHNLAWTADSKTLVTVDGKALVAINVRSHDMSHFRWPADLQQEWLHPMRAAVTNDRISLTDGNTMRTFTAGTLAHS